MKKILLFFFAIVLCGAMCAQNALPLTHPASTDERDEWVGNQDVTMFVRLEDAEFAMLPHVIDPSLTGVMTKLKFYRNPYEDYNTTSYAIKIYEGGELHLVDEVQGLYDLGSCGELVYEQRFTCEGTGWQEIELTTPYTIPEGDFWVAVKMNGMGTVVIGEEGTATEGEYFYTKMTNFINYWSHTYFFNSYSQYVLYSCGLAIYVEDEEDGFDESNVAAVKVYPNPAQGTVIVEAGMPFELGCYDAMGRMIIQDAVREVRKVLDVSALPAGIYLFRVATADGVVIQRVCVE